MSTNATIAVIHHDSSVSQVYVHWDGYVEHVGKMLVKHYNSIELAKELVSYGNISSLSKVVGIKHPFSCCDFPASMSDDEYESLYGDMTTFYGRDRGENNVAAYYFSSVENFQLYKRIEQYNYVFSNGCWTFNDGQSVAEELLRLKRVQID